MLTLREAINHILDRGAQAHIHTTIYNVYYRDSKHTFPAIMSVYNDVMAEILELPSNPQDDHILINSIVRSDTEEVDVCYYDTAQDQSYAIDLIDWSQLVDMMIEDAVGLGIADQIAHVLWEITFWGFSRDKINQEREKLAATFDDPGEIVSLDDLSNLDIDPTDDE